MNGWISLPGRGIERGTTQLSDEDESRALVIAAEHPLNAAGGCATCGTAFACTPGVAARTVLRAVKIARGEYVFPDVVPAEA